MPAGTIVDSAGKCLDGACSAMPGGGCAPLSFTPCNASSTQTWTVNPTTHQVVNSTSLYSNVSSVIVLSSAGVYEVSVLVGWKRWGGGRRRERTAAVQQRDPRTVLQ